MIFRCRLSKRTQAQPRSFVLHCFEHLRAGLNGTVGDGQHGHRIAKVVGEVAHDLGRSSTVLARLGRLPPARIADIHGRAGKRHRTVAMGVDAVMHHGRQMLIAGNVKGEGPAYFAQRFVTQPSAASRSSRNRHASARGWLHAWWPCW